MAQANDKQTAAAPKPAGTYTVIDSTARSGEVRKHEVITKMYPADQNREPDIKVYALNSESGTPMPQENAMKFLSDKAFKVHRLDGTLVLPPPKYDPSQPLVVGEAQTVADFEELTRASLFKRCKVLPGSEDLTMQSTQAELIAFLVTERRRQMKGNMSDAEIELASKLEQGELGGAAPSSTLSNMFPNNPLVT